jgi:hypothetical protein
MESLFLFIIFTRHWTIRVFNVSPGGYRVCLRIRKEEKKGKGELLLLPSNKDIVPEDPFSRARLIN